MNNKIAIITSVVAIGGLMIFALNSNSEDRVLTKEEATKNLNKALTGITITEDYAQKGTINYSDLSDLRELPDIDTSYPLVVDAGNKDIEVEIFSSPEKAGKGTDGWIVEMAEEFNKQSLRVDNKSIGISIRSISSGVQVDYIQSGTYTPEAITPSSSIWGEMLEYEGIELEIVNDSLVSNVAGVVIDKSLSEEIIQTYGDLSVQNIVKATSEGTIVAGYTNPFASTAGLNFIAEVLNTYDNTNILSENAIKGFNSFQENIPFVAYNTIQMQEASENNTFSSMVLEYQGYYNDAQLKNNYEFIPYGVPHDNPLYAVENITSEELEALKMFNEYCLSESSQNKAKSYGFNQIDDYSPTLPEIDGNTWKQIQKCWKENKNNTKPIASVFVLDTSGSMNGEPLNALKDSLLNSMKYINKDNYIGIISYNTSVNIELPLRVFDLNQQAYFEGAVSSLNSNGQTATYSALAKAMLMLDEFMQDNPNVQPMIFLLSDGQSNVGAGFSKINKAIETYGIPVYTIGYNADLEELKKISVINEATSIDASSEDVVY